MPGQSRDCPGIIPGQSRENFVYVFCCLLVFSGPDILLSKPSSPAQKKNMNPSKNASLSVYSPALILSGIPAFPWQKSAKSFCGPRFRDFLIFWVSPIVSEDVQDRHLHFSHRPSPLSRCTPPPHRTACKESTLCRFLVSFCFGQSC